MKYKAFVLAFVFLLVASLAVVSCGEAGIAEVSVELSNLRNSPSSPEAGQQVTISVDVENNGGAEGDFTVTFNVGGSKLSDEVTVGDGDTETASVTYTPASAGTINVMAAITLAETSKNIVVSSPSNGGDPTPTATPGDGNGSVDEWWEVPYKIRDNHVTMQMSLSGATAIIKEFPIPEGTGMTMKISKTVVDGTRQIMLDAAGFKTDTIVLKDILPGMTVLIVWALEESTTGVLYVEDGIGDVDALSVSVAGSEMPTYTVGDGTMDPAGSLLVDLPSAVEFKAMGIASDLPLNMKLTTGTNTNRIEHPGSVFNGVELSGSGSPLERDGGPAPYVGTPGTLVVAGAGVNLNMFGLVTVDFQFMATLDMVADEWEW